MHAHRYYTALHQKYARARVAMFHLFFSDCVSPTAEASLFAVTLKRTVKTLPRRIISAESCIRGQAPSKTLSRNRIRQRARTKGMTWRASIIYTYIRLPLLHVEGNCAAATITIIQQRERFGRPWENLDNNVNARCAGKVIFAGMTLLFFCRRKVSDRKIGASHGRRN